MRNYWSCTNFANKCRNYFGGYTEPYASSLEEWHNYKVLNKENSPITYYIFDELLDKIQDVVYYPYELYRNVKWYIRNRWIDKVHLVDTGLEKGVWYDKDTVMEHALISIIIDFCENELVRNRIRWINLKDIEDVTGLYIEDHVGIICNEEIGRNDTSIHQVEKYKEILYLYRWCKDYEIFCQDFSDFLCDDSKKHSYEDMVKYEARHEEILDEHLIRILKVRKFLWT